MIHLDPKGPTQGATYAIDERSEGLGIGDQVHDTGFLKESSREKM